MWSWAVLKIFIGLSLFLTYGCITTGFHETKLKESKWNIAYGDISLCSGISSNEECASNVKPILQVRAKELCTSKKIAQLTDCHKTQRKGLYAYSCTLKCRIFNKVETLSRENRCKSKGGVWKDELCQILLD